MKKLYTLITTMFFTAISFAQAPEKLSYQAVIRDSGDNLISNQAVGMQISILQDGTAVYTETQTPTANVNGLVSLEIGTGATTDNFSNIDWATGTYFIKTETDPAGGANYTITGTSQLLSVPYALHAETAVSVTETQTFADVVALGNTANTQLKSVTDPTDAQDAATKAYVDILQAQIAALDERIKLVEPAEVGDFRVGGVVFWVDPTDKIHGLVCAIEDQAEFIKYIDLHVQSIHGARFNAIGTGAANTDAIIATQGGATNYAAAKARFNGAGEATEWFLPSIDELIEMYKHKDIINTTALANRGGSFTDEFTYWSSSLFLDNDDPGSNEQVYVHEFEFDSSSEDGVKLYLKNGNRFSVRKVKAF